MTAKMQNNKSLNSAKELQKIKEMTKFVQEYAELSREEVLSKEKLNYIKVLKKLKKQRESLDKNYPSMYVGLPREWKQLPMQLRLAMTDMSIYVADLWESSTGQNSMTPDEHMENHEHFVESLNGVIESVIELSK